MTGSSRRLIPLNRLFEPLRQITNLRCESVFRNILPECNDGIGELVEVIVSHGEVGIIRWKTQQRFGEIITLQELRGISLQFLERNALAVLIRLTASAARTVWHSPRRAFIPARPMGASATGSLNF